MTESDRLFLLAAVELAGRGRYSTTPNPCVGCLIVRDGVVLGRGWHVRAGEGHAEVNALADARASGVGSVEGATVYVSLEPCAFHGRTPPCSQALIDAGVARVVVALADPHPRVAGQGMKDLEAAGIAVELEELPEAREMVAGYLSRISRQRPIVRLKMAVSLDGRTAMASGESQWITGAAARSDVQRWRARSCAIVTGSGTVLTDDPALTVRDDGAAVEGVIRQPLRVVLDSALKVPAGARVFAGPGSALVVHTGGTPTHQAAEFLTLPGGSSGGVDLPALLGALAARQCNEVLVEAGPTLAGAFLEAGLWDELVLYMAPKFLGSSARPLANLPLATMAQAIAATIVDRATFGDDVRLRLKPAE